MNRLDSLPESVWRNARDNGLVMIHRPTPSRLSWKARIARSEEPGDRLTVAGRVFSPDGRTTGPGVTVYAYNTDAQGYYGENHKEYPPRLYGWMKTDGEGRFELRTIHPGWYPDPAAGPWKRRNARVQLQNQVTAREQLSLSTSPRHRNLILLHHRRHREHIVIRVEQHALRLFGQADFELIRSLIPNQRYGPGTRDMPVEVEIDRHRHHEPL
jgi:protocatechuate 3,4-dioxygenase beta subunit